MRGKRAWSMVGLLLVGGPARADGAADPTETAAPEVVTSTTPTVKAAPCDDAAGKRTNEPVYSTHMRYGPFFTGIGVFATFYGLSLLFGGEARFTNGYEWLAVPIVGPFVPIGRSCPRSSTSDDSCAATDGFKILFAILGAGQVTGAALITIGLTTKRTDEVPRREASSLRITPVFGLGRAGVAGTF